MDDNRCRYSVCELNNWSRMEAVIVVIQFVNALPNVAKLARHFSHLPEWNWMKDRIKLVPVGEDLPREDAPRFAAEYAEQMRGGAMNVLHLYYWNFSIRDTC